VQPKDFNQYGTRRGNHEVMMRGTFANIRLKNEMVPGIEGGFTHHFQTDQPEPIFDVAMRYKKEHTPQILIAGKEYGTGSSRDWAAKGVNLLGVKAVVCETFERIHRSNLVGMGVLPLQFKDGMTRKTLNLTGHESFDVGGIEGGLQARHGRAAHHPSPRRHQREGHADLPHRYRRGDRVLQERRRAALRAAQPGAGGLSEPTAMATGLVGHVVAMARNNAWSNHRLLSACEALTPRSSRRRARLLPVAARHLQSHPVGRPVLHRRARRDPTRCSATATRPDFADARSMREAQTASDRRLIAFCERQTEESLARDCVLPRPNRQPPPTRTEFVLAHLFQHQIHHRGQAHAMLSSTPVKPPQLDEFFLAGEEELRRDELRVLGLPLR
jgi:uncharacterized damage-inducible protein DinB/3-isopropylmalate dehydratase small subunit